jgi:3-hydroxyacyl-[acyl-carrier-protein] dehydratase
MMMTSATIDPETSETAQELPSLSCQELQEHIPHRYPFLLVDRVTKHVHSTYIEGYKNVTMNEPFFQGHFPEKPIMPGVLQIEALAQLGGILFSYTESGHGKLGLFSGIDNVRFRRMVEPGDKLELRVELGQVRKNLAKMKGIATVDGKVVVQADMMFSFMPRPEDKA